MVHKISMPGWLADTNGQFTRVAISGFAISLREANLLRVQMFIIQHKLGEATCKIAHRVVSCKFIPVSCDLANKSVLLHAGDKLRRGGYTVIKNFLANFLGKSIKI